MAEQLRPSRRNVVQGIAVVGVGGPLLTSCSDDGGGGGGSGADGPAIRCGCHGSQYSIEDGSVLNGPATQPLAEKSVSTQGDEISVDGTDLGPTSDIPVGGGTIFQDERVVVTQPEEGTFKAFTAVCTHQGCVVSEVITA